MLAGTDMGILNVDKSTEIDEDRATPPPFFFDS